MINYYEQFIKPKEIVKDINYFYDQIRDLICNDLFGQHLYNKRKKLKVDNYVVNNYLSGINNTRLRFINDTIIVTFKVSKFEKGKASITKPIYNKYNIDGITFNIDIIITPQEERNKIIHSENSALKELRKNIHIINEYYVKNFREDEESKYKIIYDRLIKLDKSYYNDWNRLISLLKECTNPTFNETLYKFREIIEGTNFDVMMTVYKMIHQTQFFLKYAHHRQIRFKKFIISLRKDCLDENEILYLGNNLSKCFGHTIKDYNDCVSFVENVINHFNTICYVKETKINTFASKVWERDL